MKFHLPPIHIFDNTTVHLFYTISKKNSFSWKLLNIFESRCITSTLWIFQVLYFPKISYVPPPDDILIHSPVSKVDDHEDVISKCNFVFLQPFLDFSKTFGQPNLHFPPWIKFIYLFGDKRTWLVDVRTCQTLRWSRETIKTRKLKQTLWLRQMKRHLKMNICEMMIILRLLLFACILYG